MLTTALHTGSQLQQARLADPGRDDGRQRRLADSERACLVEGDCGNAVRHFQRGRVLDQDAVARRHAGAGHDGSRRRQSQRAWAGDHHHRHRVDDSDLHVAAVEPPAGAGRRSQQQHHRHEDRADLVHQALDRRLGRLRIFHQADDARQRALRADRDYAHQQQAFCVDGAAGHLVAGLAWHRQAFAGDQRFIDVTGAIGHHAIGGDALTGSHHDHIAHTHFMNGQVDILAAATHPRRFRPQLLQRADRRSGLALGARFQPFAQQH